MSWFKKRMNVAVATMAAILFVIAITLLMLAVPRCGALHHDEDTFLEVCWVDGEARYIDGAEVNNGTCARPEELVWQEGQVPLSVTTVSAEGEVLAADTQGARIIDRAIRNINSQAGFQFFSSEPPSISDADVIAHWGAAYDISSDGADSIPGFCRHRRRTPGLLRADIWIRAVHSDELAFRVAVHELLHAATLRHDDFPDSVMYPLTADSLMGDLRPARITDSDRDALRTRYGP